MGGAEMKLFTFLIASVLILAATVTTRAQANEKELFTAGVVLKVSPARGTLTIEEAGLEGSRMTFVIQPNTELQKGQRETESITLSGIEVGEPVSVRYHMSGGRAVAESCELLTTPTS
jgi:hypothetical protein